jgi:uncharacterized membrane protein
LLQAGAAAFLITDLPAVSTEDPFLNGFYLGAAVIGAAGAFSAYWLDRDHTDKRAWERGGAPLLLLWGLFWWFGSGLYELERFYPDIRLPAGILIYATLSLLLMEAVASLRPWRPIHRVQTGLPLAGVLALAVSLGVVDHPAEHGGTWAWPVFFAVVWLLLYRIERRDKHPSLSWGHAAGAVLLAAVLEWETTWRLVEQAGWIQGWRAAAFALVPVILLQGVIRSRIWPLEQWRTAYALIFGSVLATGIALWAILSIGSPGGSDPLPWFPLLNPLDTMLALGVLSMFQWWISLKTRLEVRFHRDQERLVWVFLGTLAFLWLNLVLLRAMHHWWGIDYAPGAMLRSNEVQMAMSILWGLTGVGLLLAARALASRGIWISGAAILAAVVVKLFLVDLAASATLERIVSFLAVGILLVGIGWFSPLPPRSEERGVAKNTETVRRKRSAA